MVDRLCTPIAHAKCFDLKTREWVSPLPEFQVGAGSSGSSYALLAASRLASGRGVSAVQPVATQAVRSSSGWLKVGAVLILAAAYLWSRSEEVMFRRSEEPKRDFDPGKNPLNADAQILFTACVMYGLSEENEATFEQFFEFLAKLTALVKFRFNMDHLCEEGKEIVWPTPRDCKRLFSEARNFLKADRELTELLIGFPTSITPAFDKMIQAMDRRVERLLREYIRSRLCR